MKTLVPGVGWTTSLSSWPGKLLRPTKHKGYCCSCWLYVKTRCKTLWLKTPHMHALTADGWWRTVTITIIPAWLWTLHAKTLTCQAGCTCLCNSGSAIMRETNQSRPIGFKAHSTRKSSFISGTVNQDKNLGLKGGPKSQWGSNFYGFSGGYDVPVRPAL